MPDKSAEHRDAMDEKLVREGKGNLEQNMTEITRERVQEIWCLAQSMNPHFRTMSLEIHEVIALAESTLEQPAEQSGCRLAPDLHHVGYEHHDSGRFLCKYCGCELDRQAEQPAEGVECVHCGDTGILPPEMYEGVWSLEPKNEPCPYCNATPPEGKLLDKPGIGSIRSYLLQTLGNHDAGMVKLLCQTARAAHTYKERCDQFALLLDAFKIGEAQDRITALEAQVKELESDPNSYWQRQRQGWKEWGQQLRSENETSKAQLTEAHQALRFYANNWKAVYFEGGTEPPPFPPSKELLDDQGNIARAALDQVKEEKDA